MTENEEIQLEQLFSYKNMNKNERDFYINLILNSKELTESEYNYNKNSSPIYDLVFLALENKGNYAVFYGAVSNGEENKVIEGSIVKKGKRFFVINNFYRLFELINEEEDVKEYNVVDEFAFNSKRLKRKTMYGDKKLYETDISLKTKEELEDYYKSKIKDKKERLFG